MAKQYRLDTLGRPYTTEPGHRGAKYLSNSDIESGEYVLDVTHSAEKKKKEDPMEIDYDKLATALVTANNKLQNGSSAEEIKAKVALTPAQDLEALEKAYHARQLELAKEKGYLAQADVYRKRHQVGFVAGVAVALGGAYALGRLDVSASGEDDLDLGVDGERNFRVVGG